MPDLISPDLPEVVHADLHVHLGRAAGRPVKITASPSLDLDRAVGEAVVRKGLEVIGLADCCAGPVLRVLEERVAAGMLSPVKGGGLLYRAGNGAGGGQLLLVTGCEVELLASGSPVHFLAYLPGLREAGRLGEWLARYVRRPDLGCQRAHGLDAQRLGSAVRGLGGVFGLAHAFTPYRGFYGSTGTTVGAFFGRPAGEAVDFVEIGLSADAAMADMLPELSPVPLVASSDAHGAQAIGREVTAFRVAGRSFHELVLALAGRRGRGIVATYGLDPRLGKYHRSCCPACGWAAAGERCGAPHLSCPRCGSGPGFVVGVYDRILALAGDSGRSGGCPPAAPRPPYLHHLPLGFLPGIGPKTRQRLLEAFGSELEVLRRASPAAIAAAAGRRAAETILAARRGELSVKAGGGGLFGKVCT